MTGAQSRVLSALREICSDGWPATAREVGARIGYASSSTPYLLLVALEQQGFVEVNPRQPARRGGWRPTAAAWPLPQEEL